MSESSSKMHVRYRVFARHKINSSNYFRIEAICNQDYDFPGAILMHA
jgi:hypothetical protein